MLFKRAWIAAAVGAAAQAFAGAPLIVATDAPTGPTAFTCPSTHKGLNDLGCWVTIIGKNFGSPGGLGVTTRVFIGTHEPAVYVLMDNAVTSFKNGLQRIIVQVGALGNAAAGTALPVKVVVANASSNTDWTFTPCASKIWFVSQSGNDSTAVAGDVAHPWRHMQTVDGGGQINGGLSLSHATGDHTYVRAGDWTDTGGETAWYYFRYSNQQGTALKYMHFSAYPGEDVHYSTPAGAKGGFQGNDSSDFGTTGDYVSISNFRFDMDAHAQSDASPINMQSAGYGWRAVNNQVGPWPSAIEALAAGVSGHARGSQIVANWIHDISSSTGGENHGFYADSGATDWDVHYNVVQRVGGGNLIQMFDNTGLRGQNYAGFVPGWLGFERMNVSHNWFEVSGKYGLNLADGIVSAKVWNNVFIGSSSYAVRLELAYPAKAWDIEIQYNTFYNCFSSGGGYDAQIVSDDWHNPIGGQITIQNNIFCAGPNTAAGSDIIAVDGSITYSYILLSQNIYFPYLTHQPSWASFTRDARAIHTDPKLNVDMTLGTGSSARDAATVAPIFSIVDDYLNTARPQGARNDVGAFEAIS